MKKINTIVGIVCMVGTYFTAQYASTVNLFGMQVWALSMTTLLFIAGLILIVEDNI